MCDRPVSRRLMIIIIYCCIRPTQAADCKNSVRGLAFVGSQSETWSGILCRDGSFCRNKVNEKGAPYCETLDPDVSWEYCDVPYCDASPLSAETLVVKSASSDADPSALYDRDPSTQYTLTADNAKQAVIWRHTLASGINKLEATLQVLQNGLDCEPEARQMMVYHEVGSLTNNFYGKFKRCPLARLASATETGMQMCEFRCSHTEVIRHVFLRIMEGTTSGFITETYLSQSIHTE